MNKQYLKLATLSLLILFVALGCDETNQLHIAPDGSIHTAKTAPPNSVALQPEDVLQGAAESTAPFAPFIPYGSAVVAGLGTAAALLRKYRPQVKQLRDETRDYSRTIEEIVTAVEALPAKAEAEFKAHMKNQSLSYSTSTNIKKAKSYEL